MIRLTIILALFVTQVAAGQTGWYPLNTGVKTYLRDVAFISPDSGFAVGAAGTLLRTTDGGSSWNLVNISADSNDYLLRIRFVTSRLGFIVGRYSISAYDYRTLILRTTDGGATWDRYGPDTLGYFDNLSFADASLGYLMGGVYTTGHGLIAKTTDSGVTWDYINSSASNPFAATSRAQFRSPSIVLAAMSGEQQSSLYQTIDSGVKWSQVYADNLPSQIF
jgi:photosystem II stability/assembly factor-like uncharacterized protein